VEAHNYDKDLQNAYGILKKLRAKHDSLETMTEAERFLYQHAMQILKARAE
jgi:hypothetical protein